MFPDPPFTIQSRTNSTMSFGSWQDSSRSNIHKIEYTGTNKCDMSRRETGEADLAGIVTRMG